MQRLSICVEAVLSLSLMGLVAASGQITPVEQPAKAQELFRLANAEREKMGLGLLTWNPSLAAAALRHCQRMAMERELAHRYADEPDLTVRASDAGAHFSLVEENIAVGSSPGKIHRGWLDSAEHRANLLNPSVDQVGIAVVDADGLSFAVTDFARGVELLTAEQVEAAVAEQLKAHHLAVVRGSTEAREYCRTEGKYMGNNPPGFLVRWQNPDLSRLPQLLVERVESGQFQRADIGSCPPHDVNGAFTTYRVAVLLY